MPLHLHDLGSHNLGTVLVVTALALAQPALAGPKRPPSDELDLRYDVRVGPARIGEARLSTGKLRGGKGKQLRRVRFRAQVTPVGLLSVGITGDGSTWVDAQWRPKRSSWAWRELATKARVEATYGHQGRRRLNGRFFKDDQLDKQIRRSFRGQLSDSVSVLAWLMHVPLRPGRRIATSTYTGNQVYDVRMDVGEPTELTVPAGTRKVFPVKVTAKRPGKTRHVDLWVDVETHAVCKLSFEYGFLGHLDVVLTGESWHK